MATLWINCVQCYFITIATILGTGILGLPVTMSEAGFGPFLFTFFLSFIMQIFVIYSMVELLQHSQLYLHKGDYFRTSSLKDETCETLLLETRDTENDGMLDGKGSFEDVAVDSDTEESNGVTITNDKESPTMKTNLHLLGSVFLHKFVTPFYLLNLALHFVSILISYCLAGSEAYGQILNLNYINVIPAFTWSLTIVILIAQQVIRPIISVLTLAKGSMLFATVLVTLYTGYEVNNPVTDDWSHIQGPFLMGTVALGGIPLVMPMLYDKFDSVKKEIRGFRSAIIGGIVTCFILNIMWCWAVLSIVPQTREHCLRLITVQNTSRSFEITTASPSIHSQICDPDINLKDAEMRGEISTVPATEVILRQDASVRWITIVIQLFIVISITVSYLTLGSSMLHTIAGGVDSLLADRRWPGRNCCLKICSQNYIYHCLTGTLAFTMVFVVALMDPKGFVKVLEKASSFSVNSFCGPFLFLMIQNGRKHTEIFGGKLPLPTPKWLSFSHYVFAIYYLVAILYDVISSFTAFVS